MNITRTTIAGKACPVAFAGALLVTTGSLGGCGASTGGSTGGIEPSPSATEVASVSAFDKQVTFYSETRNGKTSIGMQETGSAFASRAVVAPLLGQRLTTLEVYLALAPEGATPPPALVAAQANEAASMGRGAEVRHVTVDASEFVQKSLSSCESAVFSAQPAPGGNGCAWAVSGSGTFSVCSSMEYPATNSCVETSDWVIMGACNAGSTAIEVASIPSWNQCANNELEQTSLKPNYYVYWYWIDGSGAQYAITTADAQNSCNPGNYNYNMFIGYEVGCSSP